MSEMCARLRFEYPQGLYIIENCGGIRFDD